MNSRKEADCINNRITVPSFIDDAGGYEKSDLSETEGLVTGAIKEAQEYDALLRFWDQGGDTKELGVTDNVIKVWNNRDSNQSGLQIQPLK